MTKLHEGNQATDLPLNQAAVVELMKISKETLRSIRIFQISSLTRKWGKLSKTSLIHLPKLRILQIKTTASRQSFYGDAENPARVLLLLLLQRRDPDKFEVTDGSFVLKKRFEGMREAKLKSRQRRNANVK